MRLVSLFCMAAALSGCGMVNRVSDNVSGMFAPSAPGRTVEFVASNPDSVLLDFAARPPGELVVANETALQQCQIFSRNTAVLESLNVRGEGLIRATYLCKR
ncbi:MAG: hypothetical protein EXR07_13655 [Acetobacteraceae bacterium]|nr:hypothetical protein [Acetobacteraceae bacterium]